MEVRGEIPLLRRRCGREHGDGFSGDPLTSFFRYGKNGLYPAGSVPGDLRKLNAEEEGFIRCSFRADMVQTEFARGYYYWNGDCEH